MQPVGRWPRGIAQAFSRRTTIMCLIPSLGCGLVPSLENKSLVWIFGGSECLNDEVAVFVKSYLGEGDVGVVFALAEGADFGDFGRRGVDAETDVAEGGDVEGDDSGSVYAHDAIFLLVGPVG